MATKQRVLRISFYSKRNPELTEEEFHQHWRETHASLANDWLVRHGIIQYTQLHTPSSLKNSGLKEALGHMPWFDFDGVAEFWTTDISNFIKACHDPYYQSHIAPDEAKLFDFKNNRWSLGWEEVYVKDGKVVGPVLVEGDGLSDEN